MSEMVERVAETLSEYTAYPWFAANDLFRNEMRARARRILESMREPTPEMRIVGGIAFANKIRDAEQEDTLVDPIDAAWRAMIDEARKET